jgi:hypothetical protein
MFRTGVHNMYTSSGAMLYLTKTDNRCVVKCSCGCFNMSFYDRGIQYDGSVKCIVCSAKSEWSELLRDWEQDAETVDVLSGGHA